MATTARFKELLKKYGKVAIGVHLSVSTASITGLYIAIKNNVDVEHYLQKLGVSSAPDADPLPRPSDDLTFENRPPAQAAATEQKKNPASATAWGAFGLAVVCNKALFPIRVPITVALTPAVARFLARRRLIKSGCNAPGNVIPVWYGSYPVSAGGREIPVWYGSYPVSAGGREAGGLSLPYLEPAKVTVGSSPPQWMCKMLTVSQESMLFMVFSSSENQSRWKSNKTAYWVALFAEDIISTQDTTLSFPGALPNGYKKKYFSYLDAASPLVDRKKKSHERTAGMGGKQESQSHNVRMNRAKTRAAMQQYNRLHYRRPLSRTLS
ncbi:hypothetical protein ACLOJK_016593 [Asimina triloba]